MMSNQGKRWWGMVILVGILCLGAFPAFAIGEITPTPAGPDAQPSPMPTLAPPTQVPTPVPPAPTIPPASPAPERDEANRLIDEAILQIQAGDLDGALATLNQAIAIDPASGDAIAIRGTIYFRQGDYRAAIQEFNTAIDIVPYQWSYYTLRGDTNIVLGDTGSAMLDYDRAIDLNPRYEQAFASRSRLFFELGQMNEGTVDQSIADGLGRWRFGDYSGALRAFGDAINGDGGRTRAGAAAYYNRGLTYYTLQDLTAAIADYTSALGIYPRMHDGYLARGIAHREAGDIRQAGADFIERIEILERNTFTGAISRGQTLTVPMAYGMVHRLTFEGLGGDTVTITARDATRVGVDALIVILGPDGVAVAGDDDFGGELDSLISNFRLPADGTYTLVLSHANGGFDGDINVTLE